MAARSSVTRSLRDRSFVTPPPEVTLFCEAVEVTVGPASAVLIAPVTTRAGGFGVYLLAQREKAARS